MISSSGALAYVDAVAAAQAEHDPTQAFATFTVIGGRGNINAPLLPRDIVAERVRALCR
jgi:hypothetical protein